MVGMLPKWIFKRTFYETNKAHNRSNKHILKNEK